MLILKEHPIGLHIIMLIILFSASCNADKIIYEPIGYFISNFSKQIGAPRQGILVPETKDQIVLKKYT